MEYEEIDMKARSEGVVRGLLESRNTKVRIVIGDSNPGSPYVKP